MKKRSLAVVQYRGEKRAVGTEAGAEAGTAGERREAMVIQMEGVVLAAMIRLMIMRRRRKK